MPYNRLAEQLLEQETLSLPDIVDILGPRPFPVKDSVIEYLQELRARKSQEKDMPEDENEKRLEEERKAAIENTKFDPNAEEGPEPKDGEEEKEEVDAAEPATGSDEKKDDKDKKEWGTSSGPWLGARVMNEHGENNL